MNYLKMREMNKTLFSLLIMHFVFIPTKKILKKKKNSKVKFNESVEIYGN